MALTLAHSAIAFSAPAAAPSSVLSRSSAVSMDGDRLPVTYAPAGMGAEYVSQSRKPLSEYVGASVEFSAFPGSGGPQAWDPLQLSKLYTVSGNNPDVAWLREAELKHGRMAMLAFAGTLVTNGGVHLPGTEDMNFLEADWTKAWDHVGSQNPAATAQVIAFIGLVEGVTSKGLFDLWFGITDTREPGDIGFDPLKLMPNTKAGADKMKLKELKNGRMAMIAIMGFAANHFLPGSVPGLQGFLP